MEQGMGNDDRKVGVEAEEAAATAKELNSAPPVRSFVVKLIQTVEVCTEQFSYTDTDGVTNKKEALSKAQNFVDDEKDLEKDTYRLVVEEVEDAPAQPETVESTE